MMKRLISTLLCAAIIISMIPQALAAEIGTGRVSADDTDLTQFVDPFVGTDVDYGQLSPASMVPYALVKLGADTYPHVNDDHAGYDYSKTVISGFSHTRIEGVGRVRRGR